jgi:hypothetical protein
MPFVYDQTHIELPEYDDPPPPRADQFVYLPAPEFGGVREPVLFSVPPLGSPIEPRPPAMHTSPASVGPQRRSILDRLLRRLLPSGTSRPSRATIEEHKQRSRQWHEQRTQQFLAVMIPALRDMGVRRVYCRYDGGNDEGFSWLDSFEMRSGERIDTDTLVKRLPDQLRHALHSAGLTDSPGEALGLLCSEWAALLLGASFGTGEYSMYGAFTVDLEACAIADDPNARPVVENITLAE